MPDEKETKGSHLIGKITSLILALATLITAATAAYEKLVPKGESQFVDKDQAPPKELNEPISELKVTEPNTTIASQEEITFESRSISGLPDTTLTSPATLATPSDTAIVTGDNPPKTTIKPTHPKPIEFREIKGGPSFVAREDNYLPFADNKLRIFPAGITDTPQKQARTLVTDSKNNKISMALLKEGDFLEFEYQATIYRVTLRKVEIRLLRYNLAYYTVEKAQLSNN